MFKKITSYLLCFTLAWSTVVPVYAEQAVITTDMTEQEIRMLHPNAKIIHVAQENYSQLAENLRNQGYAPKTETFLAQANTQNIEHAISNTESTSNTPECNDTTLTKTSNKSGSGDINAAIDISDGILKSGNGSGGDGAVIVFVIIGAIVIVVWALYVFKYLYDLSTGFVPCEYWYQLTYTSSSISDDLETHFNMDGLRFTTGFRDDGTDVGIALEMGHADILLTEQQSLKLDGFYWMLGPTLQWRLSTGYNPHNIYMNFMGGTTEHDEIGVIAKASVGLQFGLGKHFHLGFNFGAMNINLNDNQAILTDRDQFHFLYGVNSGFRF